MHVRVSITADIKTGHLSRQALSRWVREALTSARSEAQRLQHAGGRSGRKYPNLPHRSSAPGEPPKLQSGALAGSLTEPRVQGLSGYFGPTANHAKYVSDFGSPGGKIAPRPYLRKALHHGVSTTPFPDDIIRWR